MRVLTDENFHGDVLRGILRVIPDFDYVRVQDTDIYQADDPTVLAWAAAENRVLLTHDVKTMTKFAYERVRQGLSMPGVIEVSTELGIGRAIDDLLVALFASDPSDLENHVLYIPFPSRT